MFSRRFYLSLFGTIAWSTTAADTVLNVLDAISLSTAQSSLLGLAVTASAFDLGAVSAVTVFAAQHAWTREGIIRDSPQAAKILTISCVLISATALIISLASMVTVRLHLQELEHMDNRGVISNWTSSSSAQVVVWVLALLSQAVLYISPLWRRPKHQLQPVDVSGPRDSVMSETRYSTTTPNFYMMKPTQPSSPLAALPSPTWSNRSSQSLRSWKESLQRAVRPETSRSKLVNRPSFNRDVLSIHSDGLSVKSISQPDAFDSWEVDVAPKAAPTPLILPPSVLIPSRGTALEPIPGSRPASPARLLDGPFPLEDDEELYPPPKLALDTSRPSSSAGSEMHIHPLFRSESPTPAPATTPGTSIIASPLANQVITCPPRPYSRMRSNSSRSNATNSNSRAASPALVHQRSFINERSNSNDSRRSTSRSPSPPSRQMTPPIPDFVLTSSPRNSVSGSQRKVSLKIDISR